MYFMYLVYSIRNEFKVISYFEEIAIEKFKLNTSKKSPDFLSSAQIYSRLTHG